MNDMSSLYELSNQFQVVVSHLDEMELEQDLYQDTLDSIQAPIEEKVENIIKYMKSLEALADAKKLEAKRLSDSASADLKKVEWFKNYMADNLRKAGINKLQAGVFSLGWRKGTEVVEVDENQLPQEYFVPTYKPMTKTELKYLVKNEGKMIPGVKVIRKPDSLVVK
jgi:hypothetical protein